MADLEGSYQGQWLRGMRHGYGVRKSAAFGQAAKWRAKSATNASLTSLRSGRAEEEDEREQTESAWRACCDPRCP